MYSTTRLVQKDIAFIASGTRGLVACTPAEPEIYLLRKKYILLSINQLSDTTLSG